MGVNKGIYYFNKINDIWQIQGQIKGFDLCSRYMLTDSLSNVWVEVPNIGIYKLRLNEKGDRITEQKKLLDITTNNEIISIVCNQLIVADDNKFLRYNYETEMFEDYNALNKLLPNSRQLTIRRKKNNSDFYFQDIISIGKLIKKDKQKYSIYRTPFYALEAISEYLPILEIDESNVIIGRNKGFVHYQPNYRKDYAQSFNTLIRKVQILNTDSVIFGGNFPLNSDTFSIEQSKNQVSIIEYEDNSLRFQFSATFFEQPKKIEYCHILEGFEEDWSAWTKETKKEYTKIREGEYTFKVKARNVYGTESTVAVYKFEILPPWYRTWWAFSLYSILLIVVLYAIIRLYTRRLKQQKKKLEKIVAERTKSLKDKQKEVIKQNNEIMQANEEISMQNEEIITQRVVWPPINRT